MLFSLTCLFSELLLFDPYHWYLRRIRMWDIIFTISVVLLILTIQRDVMQMYYALTTYEEVTKRRNYGKIQFYPEVTDFFCPTCNRHFSSYDHCHRHAEIRNHNISSMFCKYSYKGLPKCRRSIPYFFQIHYYI